MNEPRLGRVVSVLVAMVVMSAMLSGCTAGPGGYSLWLVFLVAWVAAACRAPDQKYLYMTEAMHDGAFGETEEEALKNADELCNTDKAKPKGTGKYKALLVTDNLRVACTSPSCENGLTSEHVDWVLEANRTYVRPDGTVIGKTTAKGLFGETLDNSVIGGTCNNTSWTGLQPDWTSSYGYHCSNWTSNNSKGEYNYGYYGVTRGGDTDTASTFASGYYYGYCEYKERIYCVEQ